MSTNRKITLKSTDKQALEVDEAVALELQAIKPMMEDGRADNGMILGLSGVTLSKAAHYLDIKSLLELTCETVLDLTEGKTQEELTKWFYFKDFVASTCQEPQVHFSHCKLKENLPENPGAASHTSRKITLGSSDGVAFEVDEAVVLESLRMKYYIDCNCADNGIPLPEVTSKTLSKVIEYCKKHVESRKSDDCATGTVDDDLKAWDIEFVKVD
ncbi:hypothetical protein EZV62_021071 [Acer yangbiense]|uniref:SKP1 component POZ domain-containing protein n=1 Tax=Acer yangbiense TaxID=1000413 RepID=A0A5C7H663_9ROSI|nr:hypothetical protein EZV62_021071 [Acer yangbiense]